MRIWKQILTVLFAVGFATIAHAAAQGGATNAGAGKPYSDCRNCPEMMPLPAGQFTMGIAPEDEVRLGMPAPQAGKAFPLTKVTFRRGFSMALYPVTVAQFREFVDETGYEAPNACYTQHMSDGHFIYEEVRGFTWRSPGFPQKDNYPVVCVSSEDADAYVAWLSKKTGHKYSVPNEAQYEYALRAGTTTLFFWGDKRDDGCAYSNQPDLDQGEAMGKVPMDAKYRFQCHDGYAWTSPVGNYKPNPWGLYDMAGNIWEWTSDCWSDSLKGAPVDGSTRTTGDCDARSSRGGSYGNAAFSTYAAIRAPRHSSYVGHSWGFRVVRND
ncbi:MAG TPA: SUMF1/EgtB/PvdO family nonheme iron enzyme [Sphingobium sp.]|uniref:formylglycine-generating enzyme family protein n=1 Tax=Sphingobium sp. TaxID=1912891 RepID=UPI002ED26A53